MRQHEAAAELSLLQQLQDSQDDVVDIAESRRLRLLGVVEAAGPVDGDVCLLLVQLHRSSSKKKGSNGIKGLCWTFKSSVGVKP